MQWMVIKCGGSVFEQLPMTFYKSVVELKQRKEWHPVIVHGGGPLISKLLKAQQIPVQFVDGLRVTTDEVLDVAEMVLSGLLNKKIVRYIVQAGGQAVGVSGVDGGLLTAEQVEDERLGFVGRVSDVNEEWLADMSAGQGIPVISPIGLDKHGQRYNINADIAAGAVAKALRASLIFISDIPGIMAKENGQQNVLPLVTKEHAEQLIKDGIITGGMIPKVQSALDALGSDVPEAVILNGMENHLLEYARGGTPGTRIVLHDPSVDPSNAKEGITNV